MSAGERFLWHQAARLFGPDGQEQLPLSEGAAVIADLPGPRALALALASDQGFAIRETAAGPAPALGLLPIFETLTAGSTGTPRRIRRTQAGWIAGFAVLRQIFGLGPGRRIGVLGRLVHSVALHAAIEGLHGGMEVHLLGGMRPDRQHRALRDRRVDYLHATPAQLRALLDHGALPDLHLVLSGGSRLDADLRAGLQQIAPKADIREYYGAAEASFIALSDDATPPTAVGRPFPGVEVRLDPQGLVQVRSPWLFDGYATDPGQAVLVEGWLSLGEIGLIEGEYLHILGRRDRMITVADQNVFPEAIESLLQSLPGVRRAAVLARADTRRGAQLIAVLQGDPAREAEILTALRRALGPLKAPRRFIWRQDWPELPSGKTDLRRLEALP